jgi:DNA-binding phage protein
MLEVYAFDPAQYLTSAEMIEAYLKSARESGSAEAIAAAEAVAARARARLAQPGGASPDVAAPGAGA